MNSYLKKYACKRTLDKHYFSAIDKDFPNHKVCYFCLKPLESDQSFACSYYCMSELDLRGSSGLCRVQVRNRDKQICSGCGVNCKSLKQALYIFKKSHKSEIPFLRKLDKLRIAPARMCKAVDLFDVDHIRKVASGGGAGWEGTYMLDNLTTLCLYCHIAKNEAELETKKVRENK